MSEYKNEQQEKCFKCDYRTPAMLHRFSTKVMAKRQKWGNAPRSQRAALRYEDSNHLLLNYFSLFEFLNDLKIKKANSIISDNSLMEIFASNEKETFSVLLRKLKQQSREHMDTRRPDLVRALEKMGDFYMELKWDFQSWVPLVSRILPSDICKIHKKGAAIRLDTTLVDFNDMRWERGDISFFFSGESKPNHSLTVLDNKLKVYQKVRHEETEAEMEDEVDILMSSDIVAAQMSTKQITFDRARSGWIFREDKKEMVGKFNADFYYLNGLSIESRKRREHLSEEDLQKNKAIMESFTKGSGPQNFDPNNEPVRRASLEPPSIEKEVTWEEYISAEPGEALPLGRPLSCKETSKSFKATVAMSEEFPLTIEMLLNVLEVIAPFKHFAKLRDFVQMKLPPGFPVKIDIPILPTVSAKITFQEFAFREDIPESLFELPNDYREDPFRFPDL
ncbi:unnamed protein product, partial [Meganyctiphanes norvegica]